jgi:hypothetical protein
MRFVVFAQSELKLLEIEIARFSAYLIKLIGQSPNLVTAVGKGALVVVASDIQRESFPSANEVHERTRLSSRR